MSEKRYIVRLTQDERESLDQILGSNQRVACKKRTRAQVLLKVDEGEHGPGWTDEKTAEAFDLHVNSVHAIRKDLVLRGFEEALERRRPAEPPRKPVFDQKSEQEVLAIAVGKAPEGRVRWTLRLLADEVVRLEIADSVSHETVRKVLKKGICSPTDRRLG
jgi:hypothetical protein